MSCTTIRVFTNPPKIMGLDMYLYGTKTFSAYDKQIGNEPVTRTTEFQSLLIETNFENAPIDDTLWSSYTVDYPLAYWCKTNAIHNWFVLNVQNGADDCCKYYVAAEQLAQLSSRVNNTLNDPDKASIYLPPPAPAPDPCAGIDLINQQILTDWKRDYGSFSADSTALGFNFLQMQKVK